MRIATRPNCRAWVRDRDQELVPVLNLAEALSTTPPRVYVPDEAAGLIPFRAVGHDEGDRGLTPDGPPVPWDEAEGFSLSMN